MERVVLVGFAGGRKPAGRISLSLIILNAVVARALSLLVCKRSIIGGNSYHSSFDDPL